MKPKNSYSFILFLLIVLLMSCLFQFQPKMEYMSNNFKYIDVIYYINLDNRQDRKAEFLENMKLANVPLDIIERIPAVYKPKQGDLGCTLSHIFTISKFLESPHNTCIVFEDDFDFIDPPNVEFRLNTFIGSGVEYDVCLLAGNTYDQKFNDVNFEVSKVHDVATTSGYLLTKKYAKKLLDNFKEGCALLEKSYQDGTADKYSQPYAIDQYWKRLQTDDKWYVFEPKLGHQRSSASTIMNDL